MRLQIGVVIASIAAAAGLSTAVRAQAPVNLAGHWVYDPVTSKARPQPSFCGRECDITQDDKTVTVTSASAPNRTATYKLDGVPDVRKSSNQYNPEMTVTVTSRWDADRLVIKMKVNTLPETTTIVSIDNGKLAVQLPGGPLAEAGKVIYSREPKPSDK